MSRDRARPADVLLDMLRGARGHGRSVTYLIDTCEMFGFTANTVRVTLSRLQSRGLIESPQRGRYRLTASADPVNEYVERWRLGEDRVRDWDGNTWIFVHAGEPSARAAWALDMLGFREVSKAIFARPDNLSLTMPELRRASFQLGMTDRMFVSVGTAPFEETGTWQDAWQGEELGRQYREMTVQLADSATALAAMPQPEAKLESFRVGGAGIHLLAKDPLLPAAFVDVNARQALWEQLVAYEKQGTAIWSTGNRESGPLPVPAIAQNG